MTARPARQANREDRPCPPWRVTGHDEVHGAAGPFGFHGSALAGIRLGGDSAGARAMHVGTGHGKPAVLVTGLDKAADPALRAGPRSAEHLAGLAEMRAGACPDQYRELAGDPGGGRGDRGGHPGAHAPATAKFRGSTRRGGSGDR